MGGISVLPPLGIGGAAPLIPGNKSGQSKNAHIYTRIHTHTYAHSNDAYTVNLEIFVVKIFS